MRRLLLLLALAPLGAWAFEFNVTVVWQNRGGNNPEFSASKLDEAGRLVGTYFSNGGDSRTSRAARWTEGRIETFEGPSGRSTAQATNRLGWIAGNAYLPESDRFVAGYWGEGGSFRDLGIGPNSVIRAVSDRGTILGEHTLRLPRSFVWKDGVRIDIPVFDERNESHAVDMNESELVVGFDFGPNGGGLFPWLWDADRGLRPIPLTAGNAIRGDGLVAGGYRGSAATYKDGELKVLDPESGILAVNETGWFVGSGGGGSRGLVWRNRERAERLSDLIDPASGFEIRQAFDVNDAGQILAYARRNGQGGYTVRLDPVPEPATMLALGAGLAALARRRRP
jgi:hypothetical protein